MCTAITYKTKDHYFGRTLDYEYSYEETITVCPRKFSFTYRNMPKEEFHYAIIGMAYVVDEYPLFYDGTNEKGLSMAGLNFPGNACYREIEENMANITPFELLPWVLGKCENVEQVCRLLKTTNLINISFSKDLPLTPLHWMISDRDRSIVVEPGREGLKIYDNPIGVLTNNPPFPEQLFALNNYMHLSPRDPENTFSSKINLVIYSRGMGGLGMPGDLSSQSRFIRAAFTKLNARSKDSQEESITQFFHILGAVEQQRGCVEAAAGQYEITIYTSCCNTDKGIYYYTTYENRQIRAVDMRKENLDQSRLVSYPLVKEQQIKMEN